MGLYTVELVLVSWRLLLNINKKYGYPLVVGLCFVLIVSFFSFVSLIDVNGYSVGPVVSITFDDGRATQYEAFELMRNRGLQGTFYIVSDLIGTSGYLDVNQLREIEGANNEIASHSVNHRSFISLSEQAIRDQCVESKQVLESYGFRITNFAYPYGDNNAFTDSVVDDYFVSARDAYNYPSVMKVDTGQFVLTAFAGEENSDNVLSRLKTNVDRLNNGDWLVVFFHNVIPDSSAPMSYAISESDFTGFLDYLVQEDVTVKTVAEVLGSAPVPTPSPTLLPTSTPDPDVMGVLDWERYYDWLTTDSLQYWKNFVR